MQGLWKDKRKHFLKDKAASVQRNYYRNRLRKDSIDKIIIDSEDKREIKEDFSFKTVSKIPVEKVTFSKTIEREKPFDFKKCKSCPSSCLNKTLVKDEYGRVINRHEVCELSLLIEKYYLSTKKEVIDFYKRHRIGTCIQFKENLFYEEKKMSCLAYYSQKDKVYKDFYSKEPITGWQYNSVDKRTYTNKYAFEEETVTLTIKKFSRWYKEEFSIYNEPVDSYFYNRFTTYGRRKKCCRTLANRKGRAKTKSWLNQVKKDISFIEKNPSPKNYANEKSIAWCVS